MHMIPLVPSDKAQPRDAGVGGFCDRALHIEMKDGFCAARALLGQTPPPGIPRARIAISAHTLANEIDIRVVFVGGPMLLEVVQERRPVRLEAVGLEIAQRKREAVVNADQRCRLFTQPRDEPFGNAAPRPPFVEIDTQPLQAGAWS